VRVTGRIDPAPTPTWMGATAIGALDPIETPCGCRMRTLGPMHVVRIDEGLWRWTAQHPDWRAGADWERDVGCVYWEADEAIVLVDPLVPEDSAERERFLGSLDADVERAGVPVVVALTCRWHRRSAEELAERYGGRLLAPEGSGVKTAESFRPGAVLPGGAIGFAAGPGTDDEVVYWLPSARAIVVGDVLLGDGRGGVRLLPESWLSGAAGISPVSRALEPLLELSVERVLVSHGAPVLSGGQAAIRGALGGTTHHR